MKASLFKNKGAQVGEHKRWYNNHSQLWSVTTHSDSSSRVIAIEFFILTVKSSPRRKETWSTVTETTLPAFSNAYLVFTVLVSEFRAVSVPGDLKSELAYIIYELLSLADELFVNETLFFVSF